VEYNNYVEVASWNPRDDSFDIDFDKSFIIEQICNVSGFSKDDLIVEINKREAYIQEIVESGVRDQRHVAEKILTYYTQQRADKEIVSVDEIKDQALTDPQLGDIDDSVSELKSLFSEGEPPEITSDKESVPASEADLLDEELSQVENTLESLQSFSEDDPRSKRLNYTESKNLRMSLDEASKILSNLSHEVDKIKKEPKEDDVVPNESRPVEVVQE
jgi:hypothetical protein